MVGKRGSLEVAICLLAVAGAGLASPAGRSARQTQLTFKIPPGQPMLVRSWNPATGELIGWMPMHSVAITLELLPGQKHLLGFKVNDAVTVHFPYRPGASVKYGRLRIASKAVTADGREYVVASKAPNLVRIHKLVFYVKDIDFGGSKWRQPTVTSPAQAPRSK